MGHRFVVMRNGQLETYHDYDLIPTDIEHIIEFMPEMPSESHSGHDHAIMSQWRGKLRKLMERTYGNASS